MHLAIRGALADAYPWIRASVYDVPAPGPIRRLAGASVPGLARADLDFGALRAQIAQSVQVRAHVRRLVREADVTHWYSHNVALMSTDLLRARPSVVSTDCTTAQGAYHLPYRSPTPFTATAVRAAQVWERRVYDAATIVVAQSEWAATSLHDAYGVEQGRLRVIPFGLPDVALPPPHVGRAGELPEVTFVGMSMARKGGDRLLRLMGGPLRHRCVLNVVTRAPVPKTPGVRVHADFRPGDPRLAELLARTAVFALPTEMDNSPYAVLEAMRAGRPVVSTRVGGIPEMVEHGVTGLLVAHDDDALAEAIGALLDDPGAAAAMGDAGRRRFLARYDAVTTTGALLDALTDAAGAGARRDPDRLATGSGCR